MKNKRLVEKYLDAEKEYWDYSTDSYTGDGDVVDRNHTGVSFYDQFLNTSELEYLRNKKNLQGKIVMMSPKEYYQECAYKIFNTSVSSLKNQRNANRRTIDKLHNVIKVYKKKLCMPMINYADRGQEGLHRMMTIGEIFGWDHTVPVLVVDWYDADRAEREEREAAQAKIDKSVEHAVDKTLEYKFTTIDDVKSQLQFELERAFEFHPNVKVPHSIDLRETDSALILTFNKKEYPISKDDVQWKDSNTDWEDIDIDIDDISSDEDFLVRYFGKDWKDTHPHLKDTFNIKEDLENTRPENVLILKTFGKTYPGEGCIFIAPSGEFINIYPQLDDHEDLCYWLEEHGFDENPEDASWFVTEFNYIRCRNSRHLSFVELPASITNRQLTSLEEWMCTRIKSNELQVITSNNVWKNYNLEEYFPEDIMNLIRRFYSSGQLYEDYNSQQELDKETIIKVLEEHNHCYYQDTSMVLEMICEKLFYEYNIDARYSGRSIYIDNLKIATIKVERESKDLLGMYGYTVFI